MSATVFTIITDRWMLGRHKRALCASCRSCGHQKAAGKESKLHRGRTLQGESLHPSVQNRAIGPNPTLLFLFFKDDFQREREKGRKLHFPLDASASHESQEQRHPLSKFPPSFFGGWWVILLRRCCCIIYVFTYLYCYFFRFAPVGRFVRPIGRTWADHDAL